MPRPLTIVATLALFAAAGCATPVAPVAPVAPGRARAHAVALALEGVPNLHRVAPGLYRSAQPSAEGMQNLAAHGIRTVVNLRAFHSDRFEIAGTGLEEIRLPTHAWAPSRDAARRFLAIATDPSRQPVLVHCQHGADRTGVMVALYRVAVDGWTRDAALEEMTDGGFGYHAVWTNLPPWVRSFPLPETVGDESRAASPGAPLDVPLTRRSEPEGPGSRANAVRHRSRVTG